MNLILGLNAFHPDSAACVLRDGKLVAAVAEERLGLRHKHVAGFPGRAIAEALAHGTPVITTDATPWSDIQRIGCGWIVPPDLELLRLALREALNTSPEQLRLMGERGRSWASEQFSLESVIRKLDATYLWLTGKGEKPGHVV